MTVEVYKPALKSRPVRSSSVRTAPRTKPVTQPIETTLRDVRHVYHPIAPRTDLVLAIEAMTHPNEPSFAELEDLIYSELL